MKTKILLLSTAGFAIVGMIQLVRLIRGEGGSLTIVAVIAFSVAVAIGLIELYQRQRLV